MLTPTVHVIRDLKTNSNFEISRVDTTSTDCAMKDRSHSTNIKLTETSTTATKPDIKYISDVNVSNIVKESCDNCLRLPFKNERIESKDHNALLFQFQSANKLRIKFEQIKCLKRKAKKHPCQSAKYLYHPIECNECHRRVGRYFITTRKIEIMNK